jgi:HSP20 family protein
MKLTRREQRQDRGAMTPSSGGGWPELSRIRSEINRIFEDPFSMAWPSTSFYEGWAPPVDIYEDKDKYIVKAEVPGMRKEDLNVTLDGNTLSISGERKAEEEKREGESYRAERFFGRFQRSVTLPMAVAEDKIQATYKDGVLSIQVPKSEEAKPKQIQVKTS